MNYQVVYRSSIHREAIQMTRILKTAKSRLIKNPRRKRIKRMRKRNASMAKNASEDHHRVIRAIPMIILIQVGILTVVPKRVIMLKPKILFE